MYYRNVSLLKNMSGAPLAQITASMRRGTELISLPPYNTPQFVFEV